MSKNPSVTAVVGGQWGDEGKGKIVDYLAKDADIVIRAQGGDNAGHTIKNDKGKFALRLIPAGIFNSDTTNIIGAGTALNPRTLFEELYTLESRNVSTKNLLIDPKAHLAFDYHRLLDGHQEESLGNYKIGTTKRGIGPTYMDRVERIGLPARMLLDTEAALKQLNSILERKRKIYPSLADKDEFQVSYYEDLLKEAKERLAGIIVPVTELIAENLYQGKSFLMEGAQGALLDINHGTYPRVTSSNTIVAGLLAGSGVPPRYLTRAVGVFKAYQSRVGEGGMPTELKDAMGDKIREAGHEYGVNTGRPRRVGWFDGAAARYAQAINGFTDIALTRIDTIANFDEINLCTGYENDEAFSPDDKHLFEQKPILKKFEGWGEFSARNFNELPEAAQKYCKAVEELFVDAKLTLVGTGEAREDLLVI